MKIQFWGAAGTVTGSRHALFLDGRTLLVDCGLYQGLKELRLRNWQPLPLPAREISDVLVTHAHIDHTGYLPRLVKDGFKGNVWATPATAELMRILLPDTGRLQEEEASYANRKGYSRHRPALALFTENDARRVFSHLRTLEYGRPLRLGEAEIVLHDAGHILGSAMAEVRTPSGNLLFTGDIGRLNAPIVEDPTVFTQADYLVFETTYGDREREDVSAKDDLASAVDEGLRRGGAVVIPAFAVERTQELLYLLGELQDEGRLPRVPIYVDSPMAVEVLQVFNRHPELYDEEALRHAGGRRGLLSLRDLHVASSTDQSKAINHAATPLIIVSSSGMATGGRVVHHLAHRLPDPESTVLLVGYQAVGTRGRQLQEGQSEIKMLGRKVPVRAAIRTVRGFSGHADARELMGWMRNFQRPPRIAFAVHGEPASSQAFARRLRDELGWRVEVPAYLDAFELSRAGAR